MKAKAPKSLIVLSFIAFISLGLPDGLLGVAWPGIRQSFQLPLDAIGFLLLFSTIGYTFSSFFSETIVQRLSLGGLLSLSCAATATALSIYSFTPFWPVFVLASTLGGMGAGAIDAGINSYIAQNHSERMMQWLHASFGVGVTIGPVIMTTGIALTSKWQPGYWIVAGAQFTLALLFFLTRKMWEKPPTQIEEKKEENTASLAETLKQSGAWLSLLMFFIYTGVELGLGLWSYSLMTESRGVDPTIAGFITGSYWGMFTLGRILAGWYSRKFSISTLIYLSLGSALFGTILLALDIHQAVTVAGIGLVGFSIAPVFPGLVSDTENRVGKKYQAQTIGIQIGGAGIGAAVVPSLAGVLARHMGLEIIPIYLMTAIILLILSFRLSHGFRKHTK